MMVYLVNILDISPILIENIPNPPMKYNANEGKFICFTKEYKTKPNKKTPHTYSTMKAFLVCLSFKNIFSSLIVTEIS